MSFVYTNARRAFGAKEIDLANDDFRVALLMDSTTATGVGAGHSSQEDVSTISAIDILAEFDGDNYSRIALSGQSITANNTLNIAIFDAVDTTWTLLGSGTSGVVAAIVYQHNGADSTNVPILLIDDGGFPINPASGDITLQWGAAGILTL